MMDEKTAEMLAEKALKARESSYCPYSGFAVGAALLAADGRVYTGCNIENAAFGPSVCAERVAVFKAVSEGVRGFKALAVAGGPAGKPASSLCTPCGVCRQVLAEFCASSFPVVCAFTDEEGAKTEWRIMSLGELLPESFGPGNLE